MVTPTHSPAAVFYPESDGQPMAETDVHRDLMIDLIAMLREYFHDDPHVYISGNLLLYYEEGNPRRSVAPMSLWSRASPATAAASTSCGKKGSRRMSSSR